MAPFGARAVSLVALTIVASCGGGGDPGRPSDAASARETGMEAHGSTGVLEGVRGTAPAAREGIPAIVTLTPAGPPDAEVQHGGGPDEASPPVAAPARGVEAVVDQFGLAFSPRVLVAEAGSTVRFTNSEGAITHNVHVRSVSDAATVFNGDTGPSESLEVELPDPGGYDVLCDMHPGMTGFVFITEAPYAVAAENGGAFRLGALPPGDYTARVWTVDGGWAPPRTVTITDDPLPLDLTVH